MNFQQWLSENYSQHDLDNADPKYIANLAWNAAKFYEKPVANIIYVDYPCNGFTKNNNQPFWTVRNTGATVIKQDYQSVCEWAINNGFRIEGE